VKVPAGIQNGKMLRIREEGVPAGGRRGNLYIKLMVQIPAKLSKRGRELLEELSKTEGENDAPKPIPLSEFAEH
jgi:molecular chaperone DnaJ